jgi:hypothetical protein
MILDRFRVLGVVGKGVFSTVLKCIDNKSILASAAAANGGDAAGDDGIAAQDKDKVRCVGMHTVEIRAIGYSSIEA